MIFALDRVLARLRGLVTDSRKSIAAKFLVFAAINYLAFIVIGVLFARNIEGDDNVFSKLYLSLVVAGHMPFLAFLAIMPCLLAAIVWPRSFWLRAVSPVLVALVICLLVVDLFVFAQYRFHLNTMVWELLFDGDAGKIFRFGVATWFAVAGFVLFVIFVELFFAFLSSRFFIGAIQPVSVVFSLVSFVICISAHVFHAYADASYLNCITRIARVFPVYFPLTVGDRFYSWGLVDRAQASANQALDKERSFALNYPTKPLVAQSPNRLFNIVLIAVDSWRFDVLNETTMPLLWSERSQFSTFLLHKSGSNGTRGGVFSLFYGLPSLFWDDTIAERRGPLLIKRLRDLRYEVGIFASAPITSPTFDKNVFVDVHPLRRNTMLNGEVLAGYKADQQAFAEWKDFFRVKAKSQSSGPTFSFLFFDAPHDYSYPYEHSVFHPSWTVPKYLLLNNTTDVTPMKNLYRNSVHFVDEKISQVLNEIRNAGLWENTIVMITGDHGQELNDLKRNYWGHGSNFANFQLQVPMWVRWPGKPAKEWKHGTSHYDVVPTLMRDALGVQNSASEFSFGTSLFEAKDSPWFLAGSFDNFGIIESDRITVKYSTGNYDVFSLNMAPLNEPMRSGVVSNVLQELRRFYR